MSCENCENFQASGHTYFYRWGKADIEVKACNTHVKEVFDILSRYQAIMGDKEYQDATDGSVDIGERAKVNAAVLGMEARARSLRSGNIASVPKGNLSDASGVDRSPIEGAEDYNFLASSLEEAISLLNDLIKAIWVQGGAPFDSQYDHKLGELMGRSMYLIAKVGEPL